MSQAAFERLLGFLDSDPETASQKLERITAKLTKFFQWRGCATPDEFASKTIDRVVQRLVGGMGPPVHNAYLFFHSAAVDLLREHSTQPEKERTSARGSLAITPVTGPVKPQAPGIEALDLARLRQCLQECLSALPRESLELITKYHSQGDGPTREARKELALSMGIPQTALRMKVFTIRSSLESCVSWCLKASGDHE